MYEHGSYQCETKGEVIICSLNGAFNETGITSCLNAQKQAIKSFGSRRCFLLVDCTELTGATPEAYKTVDDFYRDLNYPQLVAIAIIHTQYVLARLEERDIPQMKNHNIQVFANRKSALSWFEEAEINIPQESLIYQP
ncbi:hypothetical protein [Vibrio sp. SCSIO 43137]|uniref:hypothetical protein n=1 Tax=Vibrio sp. SCSIO 43137 TaxID=3021011 RepID=UPI00230792E7|nr:hypothetical protein [Vibrio sp. SCSIO 43137]WCE32506.1 hypothetical protein PK654_18620 [Vibrio sp. SCSIO 43137]